MVWILKEIAKNIFLPLILDGFSELNGLLLKRDSSIEYLYLHLHDKSDSLVNNISFLLYFLWLYY